MNSYKLDLEKYAALARQAVAEGCVLLENEGQALPLRDGERVAVFGRMAFHYYKSGLWLWWFGEYKICRGDSGCFEGV